MPSVISEAGESIGAATGAAKSVGESGLDNGTKIGLLVAVVLLLVISLICVFQKHKADKRKAAAAEAEKESSSRYVQLAVGDFRVNKNGDLEALSSAQVAEHHGPRHYARGDWRVNDHGDLETGMASRDSSNSPLYTPTHSSDSEERQGLASAAAPAPLRSPYAAPRSPYDPPAPALRSPRPPPRPPRPESLGLVRPPWEVPLTAGPKPPTLQPRFEAEVRQEVESENEFGSPSRRDSGGLPSAADRRRDRRSRPRSSGEGNRGSIGSLRDIRVAPTRENRRSRVLPPPLPLQPR